MSEQQEGRGKYGESKRREHGLMRVGIVALIAVVLLAFGVSALQQSSWSQGYMTGLMAGGDSEALAQYVLYNNRTVGHSSGFGFLWLLAIGFFALMAAGKFMRMRTWRMAGGPENTEWRAPWHHRGSPWNQPCPDTTQEPAAPEVDSALTPSTKVEDDASST